MRNFQGIVFIWRQTNREIFKSALALPLRKGNLEQLRTFEIVILNTKWKDYKSHKNLFTENFTYTKKFYVHEIAAIDLSKIYFLKNAKKT